MPAAARKGCLWDSASAILKSQQGRKERSRMSEYEIRYVGGHVEVYSRGGSFLFSADTLREAMEELAL